MSQKSKQGYVVGGDVVEGGFFLVGCCEWPLVKWLTTI